ncbi:MULTISPECIES: helix-turn-helix domain-containing protein [unclassified Streptomyces]|uniref:helix-turn-helix domain-containing protein n=1 Tax=unclassified Streptomyces TaxID=2593676 RepID=UPI000223B3C4|nr:MULTISPECIES: helix-turn-helix domain-containing protein [unclassified Streptomyces]AEN10631.1 Helix-turn-helix, AraC domain protein [Streptomyces sp. SirexAA-E]MYR67174.1 helix-turn-helix domain-containing protein [Streptomyces sp. SID4939]MYS04710.1 helix-turn-helix domain-containing protein [Streptomyces sp. SID4940]MYT62180.1 helix-turn-helix domain-containing protein [Streptomyces sp. SID8357]MYT84024.1 helix-turn-helix domain-containing protein [Streptomyces sp. SID8360]
MARSARDTRGIVDAPDLFSRVRFRLREPAPGLRPYLEHYWLIDWDLAEPYTSHVVPHPSVHLVFQQDGSDAGPAGRADVYGIVRGLFTRPLEGRGRVCGVKFRPGAFRPFAPRWPVSEWTGRHVPAHGVLPAPPVRAVLGPEEEDARVAALDAYLLPLVPPPDPKAEQATALAELARTDRTLLRADALARAGGLSARSLQRLFSAYVGVGPKWVLLRHRIHEALRRAATDPEPDWAALAADLGYSDQAHLVRDFTATVGVPPTAFAPQG